VQDIKSHLYGGESEVTFSQSVDALRIYTTDFSKMLFEGDVHFHEMNVAQGASVYMADGVSVGTNKRDISGYQFYKKAGISAQTNGSGRVEFLGDGSLGVDIGSSELKLGEFIVNGNVDLSANIHAYDTIISSIGNIVVTEDLTFNTNIDVKGGLTVDEHHIEGIDTLILGSASNVNIKISDPESSEKISGQTLILKDGATINLAVSEGGENINVGDEFSIFNFNHTELSDDITIVENIDHLEFATTLNDDGNVLLRAEAADGYLLGSDEQNTLYHFNDDATILGFDGNDVLLSFGKNGVIDGGQGDDFIMSSGQNHNLIGGEGNDLMINNAMTGITEFVGGVGKDIMLGGGSEDHFIFTSLDDSVVGQYDIIVQFDKYSDVLDLSALGIESQDVLVSYHDGGVSRIAIDGTDFELWVYANQNEELADWNFV